MGVFEEPEVFLFGCWKAVNEEKSKTGNEVREMYQDCIMLCLVKHGKMLDFSLIGSPGQAG